MEKPMSKIRGADLFTSLKGPTIYGIFCAGNQRIYIGQSIRPKQRVSDHLRSLVQGVHDNSFLQNSWNKYGVESFQLMILESGVEDLDKAEQRWFDRYSELLFNILLTPRATPQWKIDYDLDALDEVQQRKWGAKKCWETRTDEEKAALLAEVKIPHHANTRLSPETRAIISEKNRQRWKEHPMTAEQRKSLGRTYIAESPEGREVEFTGLALFADQHGLNRKKLSEVMNERSYSHKGWKLPARLRTRIWKGVQDENKPVEEKVYRSETRKEAGKKIHRIAELRKQGVSCWPTLIDPQGNEHRGVLHFHRFCKDHGVDGNALAQAIRFRRPQYLGWRIVYDNPNLKD